MPSSENPPNRRIGTDKGPSQALCAIARPMHAAVTAMHKVKTTKRAVKGRKSARMESLGRTVATAMGLNILYLLISHLFNFFYRRIGFDRPVFAVPCST
jgi:chorismate synthase